MFADVGRTLLTFNFWTEHIVGVIVPVFNLFQSLEEISEPFN